MNTILSRGQQAELLHQTFRIKKNIGQEEKTTDRTHTKCKTEKETNET